VFFAAAALLRAAEADPAALGFDAARLARLDAVIQAQVDQKKVAGVVLHVSRDGKPVRHRAYGAQDVEAGKLMPAEVVFRIASMSKAVTSLAVMMLCEEGMFMLKDPVSKFIPEFARSVVAVERGKGTTQLLDKKYDTVPAKRPIQIRDLLAYTAGLTYGDGLAVDDYKAAGVYMWYFANKDEPIGDAIKRLAKPPLHGQPGEVYQYGLSTDVLGYLVEVASGMPLGRFSEERIFRPLKMHGSSFFLPPEKAARLAPVYGPERGKLLKTDQGDYVTGPRKCFSGGAGLLSTAGD
jgi:CubicO group peptidase (beta-lactamase class C family)